jgi:hypothetical protein
MQKLVRKNVVNYSVHAKTDSLIQKSVSVKHYHTTTGTLKRIIDTAGNSRNLIVNFTTFLIST